MTTPLTCPAQAFRAGTLLEFDGLQYGPERRRDIGTLQADRDIGMQEADLVAAIITRAARAYGVKWHAPDQPRHGIGELNFPAGAFFLTIELDENLWLEDVAADDAEARWRVLRFGLFHHAFD